MGRTRGVIIHAHATGDWTKKLRKLTYGNSGLDDFSLFSLSTPKPMVAQVAVEGACSVLTIGEILSKARAQDRTAVSLIEIWGHARMRSLSPAVRASLSLSHYSKTPSVEPFKSAQESKISSSAGVCVTMVSYASQLKRRR